MSSKDAIGEGDAYPNKVPEEFRPKIDETTWVPINESIPFPKTPHDGYSKTDYFGDKGPSPDTPHHVRDDLLHLFFSDVPDSFLEGALNAGITLRDILEWVSMMETNLKNIGEIETLCLGGLLESKDE